MSGRRDPGVGAVPRSSAPLVAPVTNATVFALFAVLVTPALPAASTLPAMPSIPAVVAAQATPDSIPADTIPPDTIPPDTIPADSLTADSLAADSVVLEHMPAMDPLTEEGWTRGVWEWDQDELLGSKAVSLFELLEEVPGIVPLRGGDIGQPRGVSAFGGGGGGVRVYRDGVEVLPLEGSMPDLSRISVADAQSVRVERRGDGVEIHLRGRRADDARPYSRIEVGTGDLDTNLLEGVFFHPTALAGNVGASLKRNDTQGPRQAEPGSITSVGLRYAYLRGEDLGISAEFLSSISNRDTLYTPGRVERSDVTLKGRWSPTEDVTGEIFWNRALANADSTDGVAGEFPFRSEARSQLGARLRAERGPVSGLVSWRELSGDGLPNREISARIAGDLPELGGLSASWTREGWAEKSPATFHVEGWTAPRWGVSVFASLTDFERGVPFLPPAPDGAEAEPPELPDTRFFSGTTTRLGGRAEWRGAQVSAALLDLERDSVHPLGLPMDRGGPGMEVGSKSGWEVAYRVPLPLLDGLSLRGHAQVWEEDTDTEEEAPSGWAYFPRSIWNSSLSFHDVFYPTGNLEVWADVGIDGRDGMAVATEEGATVPSYQSLYARLQIRVVTVNIFVRWENFTFREGNQDFPDRVLPTSRVLYGVRWTLWN